ncbi:class I SAM-dependent methyltransferase [Mesorhizobium neociceri]|uniref:Methyltransferase domain-containing protein n=1 Tax=Mesorhizobium neociceri TaxID=1307853 RepID=A0A838BAX4_9HYPH|nr:methyltransferase domain-containing protein [Mesorhizobium neociceri]
MSAISWNGGGYRHFDAVWVCHVLEHQPNPNAFVRAYLDRLRPGGLIVATVPPTKNQIVGRNVSLWNAGLLLYHLILAGFDCRRASVRTMPADRVSGLQYQHCRHSAGAPDPPASAQDGRWRYRAPG